MVIDTLELNIVVDNKGTTARINNTTNALKNLHKVISDINGSGGVDGAVNGGGGNGSSSRGGSSRSRGAKTASSLMKNLNFGSMIAKLYFVRNITKQLGQNLAKVVQYGIDYEETLNLWQVAMKGNIAQARIFVSEMNKAYGISSATVMNYQATFKNMLSALGGISQDTAYGLSEALSQMALDYASLYNTSIESAMTKFQAVLAGQVRPIRSESGYDITEQTLFQLYQSLGGQKTVRQLDQMEKRLLRILAVYKQMQGTATGDLAKTITSSANQLRIMKEQAKEFATWIGVAGNTLLENSGILVTINAYLYALVALAKQFAIYIGYVEKDFSIKEPIEEANTALDSANDKVDELKGKLLGFDKFQVLSTAGIETDDVNLADEITNAIQEYERILGNAENPAFQKSLEILEQWGLELGENGNIVGGFDKIKEDAIEIAKVFGGILFIVAAFTNPWLAVAGAIEYCYWTNEDFKKSVNDTLSETSKTTEQIIPTIINLLESMLPIIQDIVLYSLDIVNDLLPYILEIVQEIAPLIPEIGQIIVGLLPIIKLIVQLISPIVGVTSQILDLLSPILEIIDTIVYYLDKVMPYLLFVLSAFLSPVAFVLDIILNTVESILEVIRTIFTRDWKNLGQNLSKIWKEASGWDITLGVAKNVFEYGKIVIGAKANGGLATKGSLFYAGEAGPELVTQTSGGGSTIMNMKQLEDAVARGMIRGAAATQGNEGQQITVNVGARNLFDIFVNEAKSNGYELVKVR
jgi:hypothetical protein